MSVLFIQQLAGMDGPGLCSRWRYVPVGGRRSLYHRPARKQGVNSPALKRSIFRYANQLIRADGGPSLLSPYVIVVAHFYTVTA